MSTARTQTGDFARGLRTQTRVIGALVMREIITRYGRHNIGFMWLFVEPMMFTLGVLTLWSVFKTHSTRLPLVPFTITGYASVLLWRNTINRCGNALEPNRGLLHHRGVRVMDLYLARLILELAGASISFMVISTAFAIAGLMPAPDDLLKMMIAWILLAWFSLCMGMLVGSASARYESVDRVWHVFTYLFLPMSGAFFMVDWIPTRFQSLALLVPTVDCTELLRDGYFGRVVHAHYDLAYLVTLNLVLTLIAIAAVRRIARLVEG